MTDSTTIRDALEASVPQEEEEQVVSSEAPASPEPVTSEEPSSADLAAATAAVEEKTSAEPVSPGSRRGPDGKFKKADASQAEVAAKPETPAIVPGPKSGPKGDKAPVSWRPELRSHWDNLPAEVREEVSKREAEVNRALQGSAEARRMAEAITNVIRPYEGFIKAENSNPLQAIDNLMATAAKLRTGTAPELATMVAGIVKQFGVGRFGRSFIEQLDSALAGEVPQSDPQTDRVQQAIQQQLAPVQQFMSQFQQAQAMQAQQQAQAAASEVQQFLSKVEYGEDVREDMADILEVAQRRGREMTLDEAYRQACLMNPSVRAATEAKQKSQAAQNINTAAQRARAAAVSVSGAPALSVAKTDNVDIRSAIEAALASHAR